MKKRRRDGPLVHLSAARLKRRDEFYAEKKSVRVCIACGKRRTGKHSRGCFPRRSSWLVWRDVRVFVNPERVADVVEQD